MRTGDRIRITDPRLDPGRTGEIKNVAPAGIHGAPLYTIRLDREGWPGADPDHEARSPDNCWVDLRRNEFEAI